MKLRQTPGGTWCGTEKDYKAAMKREGIDPKTYEGREFVDVPTSKADLMEFLTFYNVNCIAPRQNKIIPQGAPSAPSPVGDSQTTTVPNARTDLDGMFLAAPLGQQLTLAAMACENAYKKIG